MATTTPARGSAVVVGATGATGSKVVAELLRRGWRVTVVGRRAPDVADAAAASERLRSVLVPDLLPASLERHTTLADWQRDVVFNCLGTTRAAAGSGERFVEIERDMSRAVMERARAAGVDQVAVVSAGSANASVPGPLWFHPLLYSKTLGEKELAATEAGFARVSVFRPGALDREQPIDTFGARLLSFMPGTVRPRRPRPAPPD